MLGEPLDDVHSFLQSIDPRTERRSTNEAQAPGLGISLWSGGDPPRGLVTSLSVARWTPPARVIDSECTFARLDAVVRALGFGLRPDTVAGEPEIAEWSREEVLLHYKFDPVSRLRVIRVDCPDAASTGILQPLLERIPFVTEEQVLADLGSDEDATLLRALQAVSILRLTSARERLRDLIGRDARDAVRSAAIDTLVRLPDPRWSAPRG
jgi:hypothetical protein